MARRIVPGSECRWFSTLRRGKGDWQQLTETLANLQVHGVAVDWTEFDRPFRRHKVSLPTYAFERKRYWPDLPRKRNATAVQGQEWQQLLYELRWRPRPVDRELGLLPEQTVAQGRWLLFASEDSQSRSLAAAIHERGDECVIIRKGTTFDVRNGDYFIAPRQAEHYFQVLDAFLGSDSGVPKGIVYLWPLDAVVADNCDLTELKTATEQTCGGLLHLVQALASSTKGRSAPLTLVTRGAQSVASGRDLPQLAQATLWGMAQAIALEHPEFQCVRLDLDPRAGSDQALQIVTEITRPNREDDQIAFRDRKRFAVRLAAIEPRSLGQCQLQIRGDASYLITGGLSGLGLAAARWLAERGARTLVLAGRSAPSPEAQESIAALVSLGAHVNTVQADVSRTVDVSKLLATIEALNVPLRGVIHSAGAVDLDVLMNQTWERFERLMAAKVDGSWNLHQLTRNMPLDFCVYYSSEASILGAVGQANYAAANAFLDGLAPYRRAQGLPGLTINWAPWSTIGLASRGEAPERYRKMGIQCIDPRDGMQALERILAADVVQAAVLAIDWNDVAALRSRGTSRRRLYEELVESKEADATPKPTLLVSSLRQQLLEASPAARQPMLLEAFQKHALHILGFEPGRIIDPKQPLRELGLDSVMAIELRNAISKLTGIAVPATALFNYPTLLEMASYIAELLDSHPEEKPVTEVDYPRATLPGEMELDNLTEEELERLLEASIESV
jgi:acyl transferase domain-containing protein/acyl carrier protein